MSTFIKAGLWAEKKLGFKGELNLTQLIESLVPPTTTTTTTLALYKSLILLITQSGTDAPTVVQELENTFTETYVFDRRETGKYQLTFSSGVLAENKTTCDISNNIKLSFEGLPLVYLTITRIDLNKVEINTGGAWNDVVNNQISIVGLDSLLDTPTKIEIRVYN